MTTIPTPFTREGLEPNRAGQAGVAAAMRRHLGVGQSFCEPDAELDAEDVRAWAARLSSLARDLSDCFEAPLRNRVMEVLNLPVEDDDCALYVLRLNVAGESVRGLGRQVGVAAPTIERIEDGAGCHPRVAKAIADRFALRVSELFLRGDGDKLRCRSVGGLRAAMLGQRPA